MVEHHHNLIVCVFLIPLSILSKIKIKICFSFIVFFCLFNYFFNNYVCFFAHSQANRQTDKKIQQLNPAE